MAPITMAARRNGSKINQTTGNNTKASKARGQHKTNRTHQITKRISAFIMSYVACKTWSVNP